MIKGGIYIHVPFCLSKCNYCDFYSISHDPELMEVFFNSLINEIVLLSKKYPLKANTLYFGGGTPSLMSSDQIQKIVDTVSNSFNLTGDAEVTIEANPETIKLHEVQFWQKAGINRVSIGLQSTHDHLLKALGRKHNNQQSVEAVNKIYQMGLKNISIDLMYGLPSQSPGDWEETLNSCLDLRVKHISAYPLQIEENTRLSEMIRSGLYEEPNDDLTIEMMFMTKKILEKNKYIHYEIANFAQAGYQSEHNLTYWRLEPYLGFGPAAASYYEGIRWSNGEDINTWINNIGKKRTNIDFESHRNEIKMAEFCFLSLRLLQDGISKKDFRHKFGISINKMYHKQLNDLKLNGWIVDKNDKICLTKKAIPWANQIFMMFLPENE